MGDVWVVDVWITEVWHPFDWVEPAYPDLLNAGYWQTTMWPRGMYTPNYWQIYGTHIGPTADQLGLLEAILGNMEKHSIGFYPWDPEVWEPGMWESNTPLRKILKKMEKKTT